MRPRQPQLTRSEPASSTSEPPFNAEPEPSGIKRMAGRRAPAAMLSPRAFTGLTAGLLTLIGGVVPVLIARHFGALGIPRNGDDWSYLLTLFHFTQHGHLDGNGWASMNLVGQIILGAGPILVLGRHVAVAQLETVVLGVVGLMAVYDLARQFTSPRRALFVAVMTAVGPMWPTYAVSFMTDVPFLAITAICLAFGARAVKGTSTRWGMLVASLAAGFTGFTIREYALVAPLAVGLVVLVREWRWRRGATRWVIALLAALGIASLAFEAWRRTLPGFSNLAPHRPTSVSVHLAYHLTAQLATSAGVMVSPAVVLGRPLRMARRAWASSRFLTIAVAVLTAISLGREIRANHPSGGYFWGPYLLPLKQGGPAARSLFPAPVQLGVAVIGGVAATVLAVAAVPGLVSLISRVRHLDPRPPERPGVTMVAIAVAGLCGLYEVALLTGLPVWDRYLLPLLPLVAVLVTVDHDRSRALHGRAARGQAPVALLALAGLAAFGFIYSTAAASRDGTSWRVAEAAAAVTHDPLLVDLSPEWTDYHAQRLDPRLPFCIAVQPEPGSPAIGGPVVAARPIWLPWGDGARFTARQVKPC